MARKTIKKTKPQSKQETILGLLRRKSGATIDDIIEATGWQAHSVRGFLSGTVKGKLALSLDSKKSDTGGRVYFVRRSS